MLRETAKQGDKKAVPSCSKDVEDEIQSCSSKVVAVPVPEKDAVLRKTGKDKEINKKAPPSSKKDVDKMPPKVPDETGILSQSQMCGPRDIIPVPQVMKTDKQKTTRNKGKTAVLTASPYYHELLEKNSPTPQKLVKTVKRNVFESKKKDKPEHCQSKRQRVEHVSAEGGEMDDDTRCIFCYGEFLKSSSGESWICCSRCEGWAHEKCTAYDSQSKNAFICDFCE